jgi:transcriptional regulator with XRE-family HTH domain
MILIMDHQATDKAQKAATLGARIVELRNRRGWNQKELARRARLRPARLSTVESGVKRPNVEELARLAEALGVSLDELWSGSWRPAKAERFELWRELAGFASPEELAGMVRLLQILLVGYRAIAAAPAPHPGGKEESRER